MKKFLIALLASALLLPAVSCSSDNAPAETTDADTTAAVTTAGSTEAVTDPVTEAATEAVTEEVTTEAATEAETEPEIEVETEEDRSAFCDLPENLNYGGKDVTILYVAGRENEWLSQEKGNGVLADGVYERGTVNGTKFVFEAKALGQSVG